MKRYILTAVVAVAALVATARTVRDFFVTEPGHLFTMLPASSRLDMLDYYDAGMLTPVAQTTGGPAAVVKATDNYLLMFTSRVRTVEMRLLTTRRDTVIVVVETVKLPVTDSRLTCYDTQWQPIPVERVIKLPEAKDFIKGRLNSEERATLETAMAMPLMRIGFGGDDHDVLLVEPTYADFAGDDTTKALLQRKLRDNIGYLVKGTKIQRVK